MNIFRQIKPWTVVALTALFGSSLIAPLSAQLANESSDELKTVAIVALAPYETLVSDIGFLGSLGGKPELGQMIEGGFAFFTQGKGPETIDKTKPWGIITQTSGNEFLPVVCLPVKNFEDLLGIATAFGAQQTDGENGVKVLSLQNGQVLYLTSKPGWAFASQSPASLENVPADPAAAFGKLLSDYDVAVKVAVKNVPSVYRDLAIQAMQAGMEQQLVKTENETDEEFQARQKNAEAQMQQMVQVIDDIDSLYVGWSIDAKEQRTFADFTYLVKPGTKSERQLSAYKDVRTNFAGFYQPDAAVTATFAMNADPKLIAQDAEQMNAAMAQMRAQFNKALDENSDIEDEEAREMIKTAAGDLFDALQATVEAGRFDGGAAINITPDSLSVVAGTHVKDPSKVEAALKKFEQAAQKREDKNLPSVQWNADKHQDVSFHTIAVPVPEHLDEPRQMLGETANIAVGIGPEAVYFSLGRYNLDDLKKAIDASAADPDKSVPPFEFALSLAPIMEVAASKAEDDTQRAIMEKVAEMLRTEAQGRDHIRLVGSLVPQGLRYRLEVEEGVLRGVGKATAEAQRQMLEAQELQAQ